MDDSIELIEMPQSDRLYRTEPYFSNSVRKTRSISHQLEEILERSSIDATEKNAFTKSFYTRIRMLDALGKQCYESDGFDRILYMQENFLYEMRIKTRDLNIRILFCFALQNSREIAVLLFAFHEKNDNKSSNRTGHVRSDEMAYKAAQKLESSKLVDQLVRF